MVIAGATGGIGSQLLEHFDAVAYDPRKQAYPKGHDVFINCIGVNIDGMGHKIIPGDFREVIDINLNLAFEMTQAAIRDMRSRGYGRIIHLSSMLAKKTVVGTCAYSASKAGLDAMVRVMGLENRDKNVLINSLNLGYINAGMANGIDVPKASIEEVINACNMLISSDLITGKNIDVW